MGNTTWVNALDPFPIARGAAANTFTTAKDVSPTPLKYSYANELKVGTIVQLEALGEYSTTGTPTMRLGFAYGITSAGGLLSTGVNLAASDLVATVTGAAAFSWHLNYIGIVTADGGTGTLYGHGYIDLSSSLIAAGSKPIPITAAARSSTIDTTAKKTWHVFAEFGTSSVSNQVIVDVFNVQIHNQGKPAQ
jgi:hypothetical protein